MDWGEFASLLSGLNGDTPLGNIVRIRSENDPENLKRFTKAEHEIRRKWRNKNVIKTNEEDYKQAMESIKNMFKSMAGK